MLSEESNETQLFLIFLRITATSLSCPEPIQTCFEACKTIQSTLNEKMTVFKSGTGTQGILSFKLTRRSLFTFFPAVLTSFSMTLQSSLLMLNEHSPGLLDSEEEKTYAETFADCASAAEGGGGSLFAFRAFGCLSAISLHKNDKLGARKWNDLAIKSIKDTMGSREAFIQRLSKQVDLEQSASKFVTLGSENDPKKQGTETAMETRLIFFSKSTTEEAPTSIS